MKRNTTLGSGVALLGAISAALALALALASPAPAAIRHCPRTITATASGTTVKVAKGSCVTLHLTGLDWSKPTSSSPSHVKVITTSATQTWTLAAVKRGSAKISSTGRPHCTPGSICPQFVRLFRVTVRVT